MYFSLDATVCPSCCCEEGQLGYVHGTVACVSKTGTEYCTISDGTYAKGMPGQRMINYSASTWPLPVKCMFCMIKACEEMANYAFNL